MVVVLTFNTSTQKVDLCEFEASLVYKVCSRTARAVTQKNPILKNPTKTKQPVNKLQTTTNPNNLGYYVVVSQIEKDIKEVKGIIYF